MKWFAIKLINSPKCILYRYEINKRQGLGPFKSLGLIVIANFKGIHTINVTSFASAQNDANTQVMRLSE